MKTAVEYLVEQFAKYYSIHQLDEEIEQAMEMEKQQIKDAYKFGLQDEYVIGSEQYYEQIKIKMRSYKKELEEIANDLLNQNADAKGNENKPNYSKRDFMNATIIFQTALMDKMYDNQEYDGMSIEDRMKMAESCGLSLRKLIHTYTGLDTHKTEEFL